MSNTRVPDHGKQLAAATAKYRRHLFDSGCTACAGGHWCSVLTRLDWLADRAAFQSGMQDFADSMVGG